MLKREGIRRLMSYDIVVVFSSLIIFCVSGRPTDSDNQEIKRFFTSGCGNSNDLCHLHSDLKSIRLSTIGQHLLTALKLNAMPLLNETATGAPSAAVMKLIVDAFENESSMQRDQHATTTSSDAPSPLIEPSNDEPDESASLSSSFGKNFVKQQIRRPIITNNMPVIIANTKLLIGRTNTPDMRFPVDPMRTYFHLVNMSELDVRNATLHILIKKPPDIVSTGDADPVEEYYEYDVHVYRYINETRIDSEPVIKKLLKKNRSSSFNDDAGVQVDVTGLVKAWVKSPRKNFGVLIKVRDQNDEDVTNRTMNDSNDSSNIFLSIEFNPDAHKRVSYEPYEDPICSVDQHEDRCCRYPLQVDFEAMGWDWIIAPKRYDAFYCAGLCPFRYKQSSPHTHLTQQIESLLPANHRYRSVGPCCSPHEYQDLKILYVTQAGTIHERRVPDMMVVRCGCA